MSSEVKSKKSYWQQNSSYYTNEEYRRNTLRKARAETFAKHMRKMGCDSYDSYISKVIEDSFDQVVEKVFFAYGKKQVFTQMISGYGIAKVFKVQHLTMLALLKALFDQSTVTRFHQRYYSLGEYLVLAELMYAFSVRGLGSLKEFTEKSKAVCAIATEALDEQLQTHHDNLEELDLGFNRHGGKEKYVKRVTKFRKHFLKDPRIVKILDGERKRKQEQEESS